MVRDYMAKYGITCGCINGKNAKRMLNLIKKSADSYIQGYLKVAGGGSVAVKTWYLKEGSALAAEDAALLAKTGGSILRTARLGGKIVKVILIGQFIYLMTDVGPVKATEQTVRDLIFADEILAGGGWLVETTSQFLDPVSIENCCRRNGLDPEELLE